MSVVSPYDAVPELPGRWNTPYNRASVNPCRAIVPDIKLEAKVSEAHFSRVREIQLKRDAIPP